MNVSIGVARARLPRRCAAAEVYRPIDESGESLLWRVRPFADIDTAHRPGLRKGLDLVDVRDGTVIRDEHRAPYEVLFVIGGIAGDAATRLFGPGSILGVSDAFGTRTRTGNVTALSDMLIAIMERRRFLAALDKTPGFARAVLRQQTLSVTQAG